MGSATDFDWHLRTACSPAEAELFFPEGDYVVAGQAKHICRSHCPVLTECLEWISERPTAGTVAGGEHWVKLDSRNAHPSTRTPCVAAGCPICGGGA